MDKGTPKAKRVVDISGECPHYGGVPHDLLTPGEAAELLGVSGETLRRWADDSKVRHVRLPSGRRLFHRSDIEALLTPIEPQGDVA